MTHWRVLAHARAVENQAVVVACNAVGMTGGVAMGGGSVIVSADGRTVAEAAASDEQFLTATLDPTETERWRAGFPALRDRREAAGPGRSHQRDGESTGG